MSEYIFLDRRNVVICNCHDDIMNAIHQRVVYLKDEEDDVIQQNIPIIVISTRTQGSAYYLGSIYISTPKILNMINSNDDDQIDFDTNIPFEKLELLKTKIMKLKDDDLIDTIKIQILPLVYNH